MMWRSMLVFGLVCGLAQGDDDRPGRAVRVAAIVIGYGGPHDQKLQLALDHLETAGQNKVDIACLPEEFAGEKAEPIPGPTTEAVAAVAKKHRMWVVCPIREQAGNEQYNTAVLIDRSGAVAGYYRKIFVFWSENLHASREGVRVYDTDFGRIGIFTCFDLNFPELWDEAYRLGVDVVFWPSAYGGGMPLNGEAMLHNFCIMPVGWGNIIDQTGQNVAAVEKPRENQFIATLDLDRTFIHQDFNDGRLKKLLKEHAGAVVAKEYKMEGWWLLESVAPGVRVRDLLKEYGIETLREYRLRSREQIDAARKAGIRISEKLYRAGKEKK